VVAILAEQHYLATRKRAQDLPVALVQLVVGMKESIDCFARRAARAIFKSLLKQGLMAPGVAHNESKRQAAVLTIEWEIRDRLKGEDHE
jgi:hypothetical protein